LTQLFVGFINGGRFADSRCKAAVWAQGDTVWTDDLGTQYDAKVTPFFLVGNDPVGEEAVKDLGFEFPQGQFERCLRQTRRTIIVDDLLATTRPCLDTQELSSALRAALSDSCVAIVGPLTAEDYQFTRIALTTSKFSIWMPSSDQLINVGDALETMNLASLNVMNMGEARKLTSRNRPDEAIRFCRERGVHTGIVVTDHSGAVGWWGGSWRTAPAIKVNAVRREVGAGDCFTAVLAASLAAGCTGDESLELGQAAAGRHVMNLSPLGNLNALSAWAKTQERVSPANRLRNSAVIKWPRIAAAAAMCTTACAALAMVFK
jgi:hypothetical protein